MNNNQVGPRTKHISVKFHHVRNMIYEGDLGVGYIRSEDNPSDIMTKNTSDAIQGKHEILIKNGELAKCMVPLEKDEHVHFLKECTNVKCGHLIMSEDLPVHCHTPGAVYCNICDDYFTTTRHEVSHKHLEYYAFNVLKEMAKHYKSNEIDAINREDVVSYSVVPVVSHDSSTGIDSRTGTEQEGSGSGINRSMNNDRRNGHGICQGSSEQHISKQEMVADGRETESDRGLSEVKEEIIYLYDCNENASYLEDAG